MPQQERWIMTTAPASFDMQPHTTDKGAQYTWNGAPLRKVTVPHYLAHIDKQMEMYNSERNHDGTPAFVSMLDTDFAEAMIDDPDFAAMVVPIAESLDTTTPSNGDTDMPARNTKTPATTAPKTAAPAPIRPTASPATPEAPTTPVLGEHLQRAYDLKKQKDAAQAQATQAMLATKAKAAAPAAPAPAKPLIMTPSTPVPAATSVDMMAELEKRVVKAQSEVNALTAWLTKERIGSRVAELETQAVIFRDSLTLAVGDISANKETIATSAKERIGSRVAELEQAYKAMLALCDTQNEGIVHSQAVIAHLLGTVDTMTTRMEYLESAVATYMVNGSIDGTVPQAALAPAPPVDVFDVYNVDMPVPTTKPVDVFDAYSLNAPVTPSVRNGKTPTTRTIPARGTGAMADHAHLVPQIREMVDAGFSQKDIAVHFNICGEDGKPSGKVVWHLLHKK